MLLFELQDRPKLDKHFDRNIMPQIRKNHLEDGGFDFESKKIKLSKLKPVQSQRVKGMHSQALNGFKDGSIRPIIIDKNNYIVNGHHRYDVARSLDMDNVKVLKVNATVEELIDHYSDTASAEPTIQEQLKAKLQQKLNEIELNRDLYINSDPKDNSYITDTYLKATQNDSSFTKLGKLPGINNSEMYDNSHTISIFIVENKEPVFLLNIQKLADGFSTVNVVTHSQHRGKALAIPLYLAVSKHFGKPLYSFGSQSVAGNRIWEKLYQQYPNRIKAVNVKTNQELDVVKVLNDNNFETRLKLLPESVQEGDVIQGNFPNNKTPKDNIVVHVFISPAPGVQPDWIPSKPGYIKDQYQLSKEIEDILAKGIKPENIKVQINGTYIRMPEYGITESNDVPRLKPQTSGTKYPLFNKVNAQKAFQEWLNGAAVDTDIEIVGNDNQLYYIRQNTDGDSQHFKDDHWYLTDADYEPVDFQGYEDPGELLFSHSATGYEPIDPHDIDENFADGKVKGKSRPGRVKRAGASCKGSVSDLRAKAKKYSGEKGKMYHWCANMKVGRNKS